MKEVRVHSLQETNDLAKKIVETLDVPVLIAMSGDLGAGKTTFTKGIAKALGIEATITSPTFTILKSYEDDAATLHHIDAYRLEGITQDLGFEEVFDEDAYCVVEWYEFIKDILPEERLNIEIELDGDTRIFKIEGTSDKYKKVEEVL